VLIYLFILCYFFSCWFIAFLLEFCCFLVTIFLRSFPLFIHVVDTSVYFNLRHQTEICFFSGKEMEC
jgi:hypothetical protein